MNAIQARISWIPVLIALTTSCSQNAKPRMEPESDATVDPANAKADTLAEESQLKLLGQQLRPGGACGDHSDQPGFYVSNITVENKGATHRTENEHVPSEVLASYTVCLANSTNRAAIADQPFEIALVSPENATAPSQLVNSVNGCIRFTDTVGFDYFAPENWADCKLRITSHVKPYQDVTREFPISLDPWATDDGFFWDCRRGERPQFTTEPARLEMVDFSYGFLGRDLEIDSKLNLTLSRHYQFEITPRLKRSTGFSGLTRYESVTDGRYHLRVLMLSPNVDQDVSRIESLDAEGVLRKYKYMSSFESDVDSRDGRIVQEVTLPVGFADMPLIASRNVVLVQLTSMTQGSILVTQPFYAPFLATADTMYYGLVADAGRSNGVSGEKMAASNLDLDLEYLMKIGSQSKAKVEASDASVEALAAESNLSIPSDEALAGAGVTPVVKAQLFAPTRLTAMNATKLCALLGVSCGHDPVSQLTIVRTHRVESLDEQPAILSSKYTPFTINATFAIADTVTQQASNGQTASDTKDLHTKAGIGFGFFGIFDFDAGGTWTKGKTEYNTVQNSIARSGTETGTIQLSRNFAVEELTFGIHAGSRACLAVRHKQTQSGILLCESTTAGHQLTESYYLVSELLGTPQATLRDSRTKSDSPWIKAIRGTANFEALRKTLMDKTRVLIMSPDQVKGASLSSLDQLVDSFGRTTAPRSDGGIPGVIR